MLQANPNKNTPPYTHTHTHTHTHTQPSHAFIVSSNNAMIIISLAQMRQSNEYERWKYKKWWYILLYNLLGPLSLDPLPPARHQPQSLILSAQTINQEKTKNLEMRSNFKQIVLNFLGLHTQNPGLRQVDLEPSPKRGSDKMNMQKQETAKRKQVALYSLDSSHMNLSI